MEYILENISPALPLKFFEDISSIPRGSFDEKAISDYLVAFANERNLWVYQDRKNNIYIKKQASAGYENLPPVLLQGHMDMVCEKNIATDHDFINEGIKLVLEGNYLRADGTTLGADNGIAVAYMMAVLDDNTLIHPPIECLITVQEEVGLEGAFAFIPSKFDAKTMINLDSEEDGAVLVSCAGGTNVDVIKKIEYTELEGELLKISIRGLRGGHSGSDCHKGFGHSNKIMARILINILKKYSINLVSFNGGNKDNAIPRECESVIAVRPEDTTSIINLIKNLEKILVKELSSTESNLYVEISSKFASERIMFDNDTTNDVIKMLYLLPNGEKTRSTVIDGLVISSLNMGIVKTEEDKITVTYLIRSSVVSLMEEIKNNVQVVAEIFGATMKEQSSYPGWEYDDNSPIRERFKRVYKSMFRKELQVGAIHAGLECGIIKEKMPDMDIISCGPTLIGCHTPQEKMDLESCNNTWRLLVAILEDMCN